MELINRMSVATRRSVLGLSALVIALAPFTPTPAFAEGGSCSGGWSLPNELTVTDNGSTFRIRARVSSPFPIEKPVQAEVRRGIAMWPDAVVAEVDATFVPLATYEASAVVSRADLGLRRPGDSATVHVLFRIPGQPDAETCRAEIRY